MTNLHQPEPHGQRQLTQDRIFQAHRERFAAAAARAQLAQAERPSLLQVLLGTNEQGDGGAA